MAAYTVTLTNDQELVLDYYLEQNPTPSQRNVVVQNFVNSSLIRWSDALDSRSHDLIGTITPLDTGVRDTVLASFVSIAIRTRVQQLLGI